jgi:hypothetical protein
MEWILLILIIMMFAIIISYNREMYLYLSLVLGSFMTDLQKFFNKLRGK